MSLQINQNLKDMTLGASPTAAYNAFSSENRMMSEKCIVLQFNQKDLLCL